MKSSPFVMVLVVLSDIRDRELWDLVSTGDLVISKEERQRRVF